MKIFNTENGIEKVYIQKKDILFIRNVGGFISTNMSNALANNKIKKRKENLREFVCLEDKEEVEYLKSLDFIIDFKKNRNLTKEEIDKEKTILLKQMRNLANHFLNCDNRKDRNKIMINYRQLEYKYNSLDELLKFKQKRINIQFPLVPDSDGFSFGTSKLFCFKGALNPNIALLYKQDRSSFMLDDAISRQFYYNALTEMIRDRVRNDEFITYYETFTSYSEDKKYLVVELKFEPYENEKVTAGKAKQAVKKMFGSKK